MFYKTILKRVLDIIFSSILLIVLAVPMLLIFVLVKVTSEGPGVFVQKRFGQNSVPFSMMKFRTMTEGAPVKANKDFDSIEHYVTPLGKFLRTTSLDELPQLVNVFLGRMSFVGPRPLASTDQFVIDGRRNTGADTVKPGITGLAQVNGRNFVTDEDKLKFDTVYSKNISFAMDVKIVALTIVNVLRKTGINSNYTE